LRRCFPIDRLLLAGPSYPLVEPISPTSNSLIFSPVNGAQSNGERRALTNSLQWKIIRLDILKRRSLSLDTVRQYGGKLAAKFTGR